MDAITFVIIPGLNDRKPLFNWFYSWIGDLWRRSGASVVICAVDWKGDDTYEQKLATIHHEIQTLENQGREVVLVGVSAGATLATLAFVKDKRIFALVLICGLLRPAPGDDKKLDLIHKSWYKAAKATEKAIANITEAQKEHIICLRPLRDRVIAPERAYIPGAKCITMWTTGHLKSILVALVMYRQVIIRCIAQLKR